MQLFKKLVPLFKHSLMNFDMKLFCIYRLLFFMGQKYLFWWVWQTVLRFLSCVFDTGKVENHMVATSTVTTKKAWLMPSGAPLNGPL